MKLKLKLLFTTDLLSNKANYIMIFNNEDMCEHIFDKIVTEDQLIVDINGCISSQPISENGEYVIFSFQHFMKVRDEIKSQSSTPNRRCCKRALRR